MRKFLIIFLFVFFGWMAVAPGTSAQEIVERDSMNFDEGLSDQTRNTYGYIDSICVVPIESGQSSGFGDGREWMKGLYYYMITHLGFLDIPFHYIVTWQGNVYEGRGGGLEVNSLANFELNKDYSNPLLIGYFDNGRGLTNQAEDALEELIGKSIGSFEIDKEDIFTGLMKFNIPGEGQPSYLSVSQSESGYLNDWLATFVKAYDGDEMLDFDLKGLVENVEYEGEATSWGNVEVKITVKNTGDYPWYKEGARATYLATSSPRSHSSQFYYAKQWSSFSRVVSPTEDVVKPGETATFEFVALAPLLPDEYSEKFELLRLPNNWISDTVVSLDLNVSKGNNQLVQIKETGAGYLTVRECGHPSCKELSTVETGFVSILKQEKSGWYKIVYDGANEGWVYGKYVKKL